MDYMEAKREKSTPELDKLTFLQHQMKVISHLAEIFLQGEDNEILYETVSRLVSDALQVEGCLILERDSGESGFQLYSACGFCDLDTIESTQWIENEQFVATMQTSKVVLVPDYNQSVRFSPPDRICFREFQSGMSIHIPGTPGPRGIIAVYHRKPRLFREHEQGFLQTISNMLAGALTRDAKEQELKESESRSKAILDTAVDGIITIDDKGNITLFNQAARQIFGYRKEEVMGRNVSMLMPEPYRREHDDYIKNYKSTGRKKIIGSGREVTGMRKDGSTFPLYLAVSEFYIGQKRHFTGIVRDISDQRSLELEVLKTSDHERRRIGQDLHDGLGQMLTGIGLMSQGLRNTLEKENSEAVQQAGEITTLIREADEYAKNLSRGLLPVDFEVRGLVTSLERLAANAERLFGITCTFRESNPPVFHDNSVVEHLFRIAQEAISNAVKHGLAGRIAINLEANEEFASLRVEDDGKGFPEDWRNTKGSGIDIMQFRAQLIGANLDIQNLEEDGVVLNCMLPRSQAMYRLDKDHE